MTTIIWFGVVLCAVSAAGKVFYTTPGNTATLTCGDNYTSNLEWRREKELIIAVNVKSGLPRKVKGDLPERSKVRETNLEISAVKEGDAGAFSCKADWKEHTHTLTVVSVSVSPSEPELGAKATLSCKVRGLNQGATVQWKSPDGSLHEDMHELNPVSSQDKAPWTCVIIQDGETHNEYITLKIREPATQSPAPPTTQSKNMPSCLDDCITGPEPAVDHIYWWMWVAAAAGCLVVVLLIVFVIVLCLRVRRRKRKFQKIKNSRYPLRSKQYCQCTSPTAAARPQEGRWKEKPTALPLQPLHP